MIQVNEIKINSEVLGVLNALGEEYINKLPSNLYNHLKNNSDDALIPKIDKNTPLNKMPISKEAQTYITLLNLQYFCETPEEKETLMKRIIDNSNK